MNVRRMARTKKGRLVDLNKVTQVEGGWVGYIMHQRGYAVAVFVPSE